MISNRSAFVLGLIGVSVITMITVMGVRIYRWSHPYLDRKIAGPVTLSAEWTEFAPREPLKLERETQYIVFILETELEHQDPGQPPRTKDGSVIIFEAQLVDQNGKVYDLRNSAGDGFTEVWRGLGIQRVRELPKDTVFQKVRIRTNQAIKCSEVIWRSYDPRDFK